MNHFKKSLLAFSIFLFQFSVFFALPAVTPSVPDISGQYVYYRDSSFGRESYIGVVYYDEATYGLRYYAPAVTEKNGAKPEKNVHILFTIDPEKENLELTGERIISSIATDDTDLVNYIHDFFYEMTARRQKAGDIGAGKDEYQDYEQFGGKVTLHFNPLVPVFNLEEIVSVDKKTVLRIVTAGQLASADDQSFAKFEGIDDKFTDTSHKFKKDKKAKPLAVSYRAGEGMPELKATLDTSWNAAAENFYTLGNVAVFAVVAVSETAAPMESQLNVLKRRLVLGTKFIYPNWTTQKIRQNSTGTLFSQVSYHAELDSYTYDFKFIREIDETAVALYTLTVFASAYEANRKYFDGIVKSFK